MDMQWLEHVTEWSQMSNDWLEFNGAFNTIYVILHL